MLYRNCLFCLIILISLTHCTRSTSDPLAKEKGNLSVKTIDWYLQKAESSKNPFIYLNALYFKFQDKKKLDSTDLYQMSRLAIEYYVKGRPETYLKISREILVQSKKLQLPRRTAKAYYFISKYFLEKNQTDSAYHYVSKAIETLKDNPNDLFYAELFLNKGDIEFKEGDYYNAEQSGIKAWDLLGNKKDPVIKYTALNLIAVSSNEMKSIDFSIECHKKALAIAKRIQQDDGLMVETTLNNLGYVYQNQGQYAASIPFFEEALELIKNKKNGAHLYAMILDNITYSKYKLRKSKRELPYFLEALKLRQQNNIFDGEIVSLIHLSEYYWDQRQSTQAFSRAQEALSLSKANKYTDGILLSYKQLSQIDTLNTIKYMKAYLSVFDSTMELERIRKNKFARVKFKTDEIIGEKMALEYKNRNLVVGLFIAVVLFVLIFIIRYQRAKTRELILNQQQQLANEEIYNLLITQQTLIDDSRKAEKKRIARDIHDGILGKMFGARILLESINEQTAPEFAEKRERYLKELQKVEQELREISHEMNKDQEAAFNNFIALVTSLVEEQQQLFSVPIKLHFEETIPWEQINNQIKINLFRILQESLQNCHKYAQASEIEINMGYKAHLVFFSFRDNGKGFDVNKKEKGIGLQNISSRVKDLGGELQINSSTNNGTEIYLTLPFESSPSQKE
ncbi:MAG: hypothetical protein CFE24_10350 [Flavobacterium sp. BFFFF2]|nr:MAG: hypothetical protein CFE24_10350 [Flavobacterium sp. BFFFF2]